VAQVQHEQQLMAAKQEQQEHLQEARQQVEQLQQQLQELRQQQVRGTVQAPNAWLTLLIALVMKRAFKPHCA
jgi:uncharacterized protein HemX